MSQGEPSQASQKRPVPISPFLFGFLAVVASGLCILLISSLYFEYSRSIAESIAVEALMGLSSGKTASLTEWHKDRMADLDEIRRSLLGTEDLPGQIRELRAGRGAARLRNDLRRIRRDTGGGAIYLLDAQGNLLLGEPQSEAVRPQDLRRFAETALSSRAPVVRDFYLDPHGQLRCDILLALEEDDKGGVGAAVLGHSIDPPRFLAELLQPTPGVATRMETFLYSADGSKLIAGPPQEAASEARTIRRAPAGGSLLDAALASSAGQGQLLRSTDDRGMPVIAVARPVQGTPWALVVSTGENAVLAPVKRQAQYVGILVALVLTALGWAIFLLQHQKQTALRLRLAKSELERRKLHHHYEAVVRQANDIIWWADAEGRILEGNNRALEAYGYRREELQRMKISDLHPPEQRPAAEKTLGKVLEIGQLVYETVHQKKDGRTFPAEVSARRVHSEGEGLVLCIVRDISERIQKEAELRESEGRLKTALQHSSIMLARQDSELRYSWCHGAHPKDCPAEVSGRTDEALFGAEEAARLKEAKLQVLATGHGTRLEVRRRGRSGDMCLDVHMEPERDESGEVRGVISVMLDITERKLTQELLDTSERRYRSLVEQIPGIVYARAPGNGFPWLYISPQVQPLLGFTPLEWSTTPGLAARQIHPEDLPLLAGAMERCVSERKPAALEYRIFTRDGRLKWFRDQIALALKEDGTPSHVQGMLFDVSDVHAAEDEIRQLSRALDQAPISVVIADAAGIIEYANSEFYRVSGLGPTETVGRPVVAVRPEYAPILEPGKPAGELAGSGIRQEEIQCRNKSGEAYWERITIAVTRDRGQRPRSLVIIGQDVTEVRQYADQVRQLQKMEAVGRLAGGIAHDFNNILTIIKGYGDLLWEQMDSGDPRQRQLSEIRKAAERATGLTRQLLAFSRRQVLRPAVLDLNAIILGAENMLVRLLGEDIRVATDLAADLAPVRADQGQIEQVLVNLAVNARDAMPEGGTLTIRTRNFDHAGASPSTVAVPLLPPGRYAQIAVADEGEGIPLEVLPHIFEPFYTTKGPDKGTGLGLSMVYGIVQQSGGFISAESPCGRGAVFTIWLPAAEAAEDRTTAGSGD